ncbi:hypothetical protein [Maritimibacter sp. DP1N21-5]|uniref:hypothetical protein n=1 Tax=Maritimibacter sp. DP1N21-5 TaxID=2836867 RepID=UPI001C44DDB6|nr:hypothetical protein [Maritimibacter sp. DP1N21-5]MBV7410329.1 hypothetical protein [Maritimibacter sp. DP1N21-5]
MFGLYLSYDTLLGVKSFLESEDDTPEETGIYHNVLSLIETVRTLDGGHLKMVIGGREATPCFAYGVDDVEQTSPIVALLHPELVPGASLSCFGLAVYILSIKSVRDGALNYEEALGLGGMDLEAVKSAKFAALASFVARSGDSASPPDLEALSEHSDFTFQVIDSIPTGLSLPNSENSASDGFAGALWVASDKSEVGGVLPVKGTSYYVAVSERGIASSEEWQVILGNEASGYEAPSRIVLTENGSDDLLIESGVIRASLSALDIDGVPEIVQLARHFSLTLNDVPRAARPLLSWYIPFNSSE